MKKLLLVLSVLVFVACGSESGENSVQNNIGSGDNITGNDGQSGDNLDQAKAGENSDELSPEKFMPNYACPANFQVQQGMNQGIQAASLERGFFADLPTNVAKGQKVAVIFSWYGVGDSIDNWRKFFSPGPNADANFPLIHITPQDTQRTPFTTPKGVVWQTFESADGDQNQEAMLFEAIMGCLANQYDIDYDRIYTAGFSGGAIMSNLLHVRYSNLIAASISMSGAWWSDPAQVNIINTLNLPMEFFWKHETNVGLPITHLVTMGGPQDVYGIMGQQLISFDDSTNLAIPYLKANGRTVISCAHNNGHSNHPSIWPSTMLGFFKDHKRGEKSPYTLSGLPQSLGAACQIN